ncbi:hypothetical protein KM176_23725 [Pseudooceanicola sp. CBS1P-1]|uniref:Uncharacterized protein n=1 Tax=Pseudooceanicola albus TaxID=2692189 RepID=A0A6L7GAD2_9RHOB|nr:MULTISPECIES: hypothetical protein [Pseudooceanicola]MBT9386873.1 hypothetical protein [Pseudooceanicola endophyticus]MXN20991.1 hypothetical protein [Pseudooceanicola albus]
MITRDLFSEDVWLADLDLLEKLFKEKLERAAARIAKEGWAWVETTDERGYYFWESPYEKVAGKRVPLSEEDAARFEELSPCRRPKTA